jgi:hypothetical protein
MDDLDFEFVASLCADSVEPKWIAVNQYGEHDTPMKIVQAFEDDCSNVMDMDALRKLVASVTPDVTNFDLHESYAKVNLSEVLADIDAVSYGDGVREVPVPRKQPPKLSLVQEDEEEEEDGDEDSEYQPEEDDEDDVEEIRPSKKARLSVVPECSKSAQRFLKLFVRGATANPPMLWTKEKMEMLAKKLNICSRFVQTGCQFAVCDKNGVFHPTPELKSKFKC